jgi:hypothetical protein
MERVLKVKASSYLSVAIVTAVISVITLLH